MITTVHPTTSPAAAPPRGAVTPPLEFREARQARDGLASLLRREQVAMAEFLIALAGFDRSRGWETLGHASLFAFLHVELKLPNPSAFWRMSAARLLQRFPDLVEPLRDGRLCCTATAELAKVLTDENRTEILPRFFGRSAREAQEIVAELQPRQAPATRMMVTGAAPAAAIPSPKCIEVPSLPAGPSEIGLHPDVVPPSQLRTSEVDFGGGAPSVRPRDDIEPLTADLRRLHMTVSRQFLAKLATARDGLSHSIPHATAEQVVEAALDLLLEKQARARGQVKRPRKTASAPAAVDAEPPAAPLHRRPGPREKVPADIKRAVWARDQSRCVWPLDAGGVCGSTHQLEVDHSAVPWARGGEATLANLRLLCHAHNKLAAKLAFGARCVERYAGPRPPAAPSDAIRW